MTEQLDLRRTYRAILNAARERRFISYGDLARANDASWQSVWRKMNRHLGDLVEIAATRNWPIPSAIVVPQDNMETGVLDGTARDGFINAAKEFGYHVSDPADFVEEQQQAMFAWAETAPDELVLAMNERSKTQISGGPQFVRLFGPLLDSLRILGGSGETKDVYREIAKGPHVTEDDLSATTKSGGSKFENQVGWARFYLAKDGLIDSKKRGIWQLTPEGRETHLDQSAAVALFRRVQARFQSAGDEDSDAPTDDEPCNLFEDVNRRFWFVGALWNGSDDQAERFYRDGIWQNGQHDKFKDHVARMQPGDRIAIKASFVKKNGLPFDKGITKKG